MDHVPPKNFYPVGSAPFRIKVPACKKHNEELTKLDERFRFYIQVACESEEAFAAFKDKTFRGLQKPEAKRFCNSLAASSRPATLNGVKSRAFEINPKEQERFFEKITRGIYFHHLEQPFLGTINTACTHLVNPKLDYKAFIATVKSMDDDLEEGTVTDDSVFSYRFKRVVEDGGEAFLLIGCFYRAIHFFALGVHQT